MPPQPQDQKSDAREHPATLQHAAMPEEDEIDLLEYWNVIWAARKFITLFTLGFTLLAVVVVLLLPVTYQSRAVLSAGSGDSSAMSSLSKLAGSLPFSLGGVGADGAFRKLMDFLQSWNLKQRLIEKYDLLPRLYESAWDTNKKKWFSGDPEKQPSVVKALQKEKLLNNYI